MAELAKFPQAVVAMARRKAQQLEAPVVQQQGEGHGTEAESPLKKTKVDAEVQKEGEQIIAGFLERVRAGTSGAKLEELKGLVEQLKQTTNPHIQQLLATAGK